MLKYDIRCRFCGVKNGQIEVQDNSFDPLKDIEDSRCDLHEQMYGDYKKMSLEYFRKTKKSYNDFKKLMEKSEFKKDKFDVELEKEIKNVII